MNYLRVDENGNKEFYNFDFTASAGNAESTIVGSTAVTTPENQLNIAQYTIDNRDSQLPTLSGTDAALFEINLISGDLFQLAWASNPDFEALGAGPHSVQIDIDDQINSVVSLAVVVTLSDIPESPSIVLSVAAGIKNGVFDVTITGDEALFNALMAVLVVVGGTKNSLSGVDGDLTRTLSITPSAASEGSVTIDCPAGFCQDVDGNDNLAATQLVVQYDTLAPSVVLSTAAGTKTAQFTTDVVFPESVGTVEPSDFTIEKGTVDSISGAGANYVATITPDANDSGNITLQLNANAVGDAAGNPNLASAVLSIAFDTAVVNVAPVLNDAVLNVFSDETVVGIVVATDANVGDTINYSILSGNAGATFSISLATGEITAVNPFTQTLYSLIVQASDGNGGLDTAEITINILDPLDNSVPVVTGAEFSISETAFVADIVGTVTAGDPDSGDTISFEIVSGDDDGDLAIDSVTGQITVARTLSHIIQSRYDLVVQVSDQEGLISGAEVFVTVLPATISFPATQSIVGDVQVYPSTQNGQVNTLYPGNTHVVEVKNLHYTLSKTLIDNATVRLTIKDADGTDLTGQAWPLTLSLAASGHYWNGVSSSLNLDGLDEAVAEVSVATPGGSAALWSINLGVAKRT